MAHRVQIVGATGYGGLGILELLMAHPDFEVTSLIARDEAGRRIDQVYPHLHGRTDLTVDSVETTPVGTNCDVVVFSTPDRVSQGYAAALADAGMRFIDYSGDFRFASAWDYAKYADRHPGIADAKHGAEALLAKAAYGVSELDPEGIAAAPIVGNPGCFAVGIILGLAPLFRDGLVGDDGIVAVDGLTGSSGAGKKPAPLQHLSHLNDNVIPYRVLSHQHAVEAELTLGRLGKADGATIDFIPHLLGVTRGILNTMHLRLTQSVSRDALLERYREYFADAPFVRILDTPPTLKGTVGSNYCDISLFVEGNRAVVMTSIDNLMKGQSGSAMQNLNLMFGSPQTAGLDRTPLYP
ncbi:MAG: N-acetyl-gamma-glutamyl-phosphate reductase [Chloroflexi bacterium]|nr:N-acetyl-gamma-glutamyl-phosphate reductase [Chloroflexota bacterium]MDA1148020.1 N-acetyl-gamma-glutamyl-phosphate reductase [Chloroflexota bacterium]